MMAYSQMVMAAQARQAELLHGLDEAHPARPARTATRATPQALPRRVVVSILGLAR